ncbi:MAG: hypothetical protein QGG53_10605, partial [Planctomycetota bacterium]|nr:hypothetical protein [Planctomycetota bacterium]
RPFIRRPFIGANARGFAPKDDLPENPARWAGLGKQPGALPLKIVIKSVKLPSFQKGTLTSEGVVE